MQTYPELNDMLLSLSLNLVSIWFIKEPYIDNLVNRDITFAGNVYILV